MQDYSKIAPPTELPDPVEFAALLKKHLKPDALTQFQIETKYIKYREDPVGFCEDILCATVTNDVQTMMQSVCDHQVTIAISANATGKSWGAARVAVWFYTVYPHCKVFTAAAPPYENLRNILWGEIGSVVAKNPDLFSGQTITALDIRRGPEDFLTGVTIPSSGTAEEREAKFAGKHQEYMLFVLDEGDAIPDDVYRGIESCMSGGIKVRLLIMFNPRHASGAVFRMQRDHTANVVSLSAFDHPNVRTGKNLIPGAVDRETTVRRINSWARPLKKEEKADEDTAFTLPDFLVGAQAGRQGGGTYPPLIAGRYKITNPALSYMTLGRYPAAGTNQLISREWISSARTRYDIYVARFGNIHPRGISGIMGLDVAEFGDDSNVAVARFGGFLTCFDMWSGVDMIETGRRAAKWYDKNNISIANVDATGVGAGVAPHMQTLGCIAAGIKVASKPTMTTDIGEFRILRDELWWRVREWLRTDIGSMLPPDEELIEELTCPTYTTDTGKIEIMKKKEMKEVLSRSPNKADALCMTFAGVEGFFADCDMR